MTDSLEGRPCATNHKCLKGYVCDSDANICVLDTQSEHDTIETADADYRDLVGSTIDPSVDATAGKSDRTTNSKEEDADSDATLPQSDAEAVDSSIDSRFEIDSGGTAGQGGGSDASEAGSSGGSSDSGGFPDAGSDVFVCGKSLEPTGTDCPDICRKCENGVCYIVCNDEQLCSKDTIICPLDFDCDVQCSHSQACEKATIECPQKNACIVNCTGELSCEKAKINCATGPCKLRCHTGAHACDKAELKCGVQECNASCGPGQDLPKIIDCSLSCSTDCGC